MTDIEIKDFIETIRNSFEGCVEVYTLGSCYQFFLILKKVFPEAEAYYNMDHVITKIGEKYYDITGEVEKTNHIPIEELSNITVKDNKFNIQAFAESYHREKSKWIRVEERLPGSNEEVLIIDATYNNYHGIGSYRKNDGWAIQGNNYWKPTHWQPLPSPPDK